MRNLDNVFGDKPNRGWTNLRRLVIAHLKRVLPDTAIADQDDAASDAIASLVSYWAGLDSSMTEDVERNWNFAVWRAKRHAATLLYRTWQLGEQTIYLDEVLEEAGNPDVEPLTMFEWLEENGLIRQTEELTDEQYQTKVDAFVSAIPSAEMDEWVASVRKGESVRDCSRRTGVPKSTVSRRRVAGRRRLAALACSYGLEVT